MWRPFFGLWEQRLLPVVEIVTELTVSYNTGRIHCQSKRRKHTPKKRLDEAESDGRTNEEISNQWYVSYICMIYVEKENALRKVAIALGVRQSSPNPDDVYFFSLVKLLRYTPDHPGPEQRWGWDCIPGQSTASVVVWRMSNHHHCIFEKIRKEPLTSPRRESVRQFLRKWFRVYVDIPIRYSILPRHYSNIPGLNAGWKEKYATLCDSSSTVARPNRILSVVSYRNIQSIPSWLSFTYRVHHHLSRLLSMPVRRQGPSFEQKDETLV